VDVAVDHIVGRIENDSFQIVGTIIIGILKVPLEFGQYHIHIGQVGAVHHSICVAETCEDGVFSFRIQCRGGISYVIGLAVGKVLEVIVGPVANIFGRAKHSLKAASTYGFEWVGCGVR